MYQEKVFSSFETAKSFWSWADHKIVLLSKAKIWRVKSEVSPYLDIKPAVLQANETLLTCK